MTAGYLKLNSLKLYIHFIYHDKMTTPVEPFYQLKCSCNQYPWGKKGSDSLSARLCAKTPGWDGDGPKTDFSIDDEKTYAEMWMGTYPVLPSYVASTGEDLQDVLDRHSKKLIGEKTVSRFGHSKLPYLPKVLSISKALPLQIHPNKEFSKKMHEENPDEFGDDNHKPEIALALSEFEAFCGFKPLADIVAIFKHEPLSNFLKAVDATPENVTNEHLRAIVQTILEAPDDAIKRTYEALLALPASTFSGANSHIPALAPRLSEDYDSSDPGILVGLLTMNYLKLQPGDALYIPADGIHAYIAGDIIECMARSDNVLNTGFCPRPDRSNAAQFSKLLTFKPHSAKECMLPSAPYERSGKGKTKVYAPPLSEFSVLETELKGGQDETLGGNGPAIVLATRGGATVNAGGKTFELGEGHVYFVSHGVDLDIKAKEGGLLMHTAYVELQH